MEEEQLKLLLTAINSSKKDLQAEFLVKLAKLQQDVTAVQESSSQEVVQKIQKRSYQFRRKSNEEQFKFNSAVEEHLEVTAKELDKLAVLRSEEEKNIIQHTKDHLNEGIKRSSRSTLKLRTIRTWDGPSSKPTWTTSSHRTLTRKTVQGQLRSTASCEEEVSGDGSRSSKEESHRNIELGSPSSTGKVQPGSSATCDQTTDGWAILQVWRVGTLGGQLPQAQATVSLLSSLW